MSSSESTVSYVNSLAKVQNYMYFRVMYIHRDIEAQIIDYFNSEKPQSLILAGIVGAGKTTLIEHVLETLGSKFEIFTYSGDDIAFRSQVELDSTIVFQQVSSSTTKRALIFVDEVQKTEAVFDALKIAFDRGKYSFVVSGSNPAFLDTIAKRRLQRRAEYFSLTPFGLPEILAANELIQPLLVQQSIEFIDQLFESPNQVVRDLPSLSMNQEIHAQIEEFILWGGMPLVYFSKDRDEKLREIKRVVERGFEPMSSNAERYADTIRVELARLHSREFAYQGVFQKTGLRRREAVNQIVDELVNHGYLVSKKPIIFDANRRSYLTVYSYVDPGIVTYLRGGSEQLDRGTQLEGYIHTRLNAHIQRTPHKSSLWYYKPYQIGNDDKLKFSPGEIDFVIQRGDSLLPIEVKSANVRSNVDVSLLRTFVKEKELKCGLVLYAGTPYWEAKDRILYWPFWLF